MSIFVPVLFSPSSCLQEVSLSCECEEKQSHTVLLRVDVGIDPYTCYLKRQ